MTHNPEDLKNDALLAMNKLILESKRKDYPINHMLQAIASVLGAVITRAPNPAKEKALLYEAIEHGFHNPETFIYDRKGHDLH